MDAPVPPEARFEVVIVGAGQAGLALGHHLSRQRRRFVILDAASEPAASWRGRWDSLTLFTPVRYDSLPGLPFPGDPETYPGRDAVVDYLTAYAEHFDLPVRLDSEVKAVRRHGDGYLVQLADATYVADQVVVATGPFQVPFVPAIADGLGDDVVQLHSADYRRPDALPAGPVLVVGGGNTGFQIAAELAGAREVHLAIGSRQTPLPQRLLGRDLFRWLEAARIMRIPVGSRLGRRLEQRDTLIGSTTRSLRRRGVRLHGRATAAAGSEVTFADGDTTAVGTVIWATGYRLDHSWVDVPVFDDATGRIRHDRGVTDSPGLYTLGLPWQHTRGSALLGWVKDDAAYIADQIDRRAGPALAADAEPPAAAPRAADAA
jgi:putative flavoprotein involved in K+ transport